MPTHANNPLIAVHKDTKQRLDALGKKGESYDMIIRRLLDKDGLTQVYDIKAMMPGKER